MDPEGELDFDDNEVNVSVNPMSFKDFKGLKKISDIKERYQLG